MGHEIVVPGASAPLTGPAAVTQDDGVVTVVAGPRTDLFVSPGGAPPVLTAPRALTPVRGDFAFSARVSCDGTATFDAAVLLAWAGEDRWAKLCLERSPADVFTVVGVVTRGVSDDANAWVVPGTSTWLRISRHGPATAFHASSDGRRWDLVRQFALGEDTELSIGVLGQSPTGEGCTSRFEDLRVVPEGVAEIRSGE
ncbi:DUF1349 domain-containing protein [Umezawaea beigongshangensis]|uniref:DUF1349 domain-containing protein n=1 Tax=Umezawaea beigongshangensis TaxID=2780383 RepID=UPI0018F171C3|nr:DUF1349 domain-containing protein [Umezawaea beigongshangensis]